MKTKYAPALLAIIVLTAGLVMAQQPTPALPSEPDTNVFSFFVDGSGFLGVSAEDISRDNMGRYGLTQVRGVGVTQVVKDSPAEKAGIRKDDVILRFDGENVTSVRKLNRLISEVAPDQNVRVAISRGGAEQELTATIARRKNAFSNTELFSNIDPKVFRWEGNMGEEYTPLLQALGHRRRIGVTTTELTKQLADYFGIADGRGVLVTSVTEDGPAAKAGVKAGDVITAVDGEKVDGTGDISDIVNRKKEGAVTLTIVRNKSQLTLSVTPKAGEATFRTITRPTLGRTIAIPRIQFPAIPDVDITVPAIDIPAIEIPAIEIPSINISHPRVVTPRIMTPRVITPRIITPRARIVWTTVGPI
ncbi:MAG TPA: PDZ domain-containing protein [Pyrinomonadaceae bacterium]|nr:PDZ domain-containing protein [Pyrinomonadaceae bacterium]